MSNSFQNTELYQSIVHLVNVIPDEDWDGWEDSGQARQVKDAIERVGSAIDSSFDELGVYAKVLHDKATSGE